MSPLFRAAFIPCCALAACDDAGGRALSDSANAADEPDTVAVWSVSGPDLQIGVAEGDPRYEMHRMLSAVGLPDGRIAVLNAGSHELRIYDSGGRLQTRTGRKGDGPGEFQNPVRVHVLGDTLAIVDIRSSRLSLHRVSLHDFNGRLITTRQLDASTEEWAE